MPSNAAVYVRISDDTAGLGLGVERQEKDCRKLAAKLGWTVAEVYADNDRSAFSGKARPAYTRLLEDFAAGSRDGLVVWDIDRLTRSPSELEHLIDVAEQHRIAMACVGGDVDLSTPQGRLTARIKGSVARHEVEQQSRRLKRKFTELAEAGYSHGPVPFGWRRADVRDEAGRRTGSWESLDPVEAGLLREAIGRTLAGDSLRGICKDFEARGIATPKGAANWHTITLRQLLLRDRNAGIRTVGKGAAKQAVGTGQWEPLIDQATFERVRSVLTDPARITQRPGAVRHLLSGLLICGNCGSTNTRRGVTGGGNGSYGCVDCHKVRITHDPLDDHVTALIVKRLARRDGKRMVAAPKDGEAADALSRHTTIRASLDDAADQYADGAIDGQQLARITARLRPHLAEAEAEVRTATRGADLSDLAADNIAQVWPTLSISRRRAVIQRLMRITIMPATKKGGTVGLRTDRVQIEWLA